METMGWQRCLLVLRLVENIGQAALATVLAVKVGGHEHTCTTLLIWALTAQTGDLAILINLVILKHSQFDLLLLVLVLLGGGVVLLLALLGATPEAQHQVKCGLLLDVVVAQGAAILQLLASEDQPLLVW